MNVRFISILAILLLATTSILFLWKQTIVLTVLLILFAFIKHIYHPIKKELYWYLLLSLGGAVVEILLVNYGHAWSYTNTQFFNIPIWMPLFWGLLGTSTIVQYEEFIKQK